MSTIITLTKIVENFVRESSIKDNLNNDIKKLIIKFIKEFCNFCNKSKHENDFSCLDTVMVNQCDNCNFLFCIDHLYQNTKLFFNLNLYCKACWILIEDPIKNKLYIDDYRNLNICSTIKIDK